MSIEKIIEERVEVGFVLDEAGGIGSVVCCRPAAVTVKEFDNIQEVIGVLFSPLEGEAPRPEMMIIVPWGKDKFSSCFTGTVDRHRSCLNGVETV